MASWDGGYEPDDPKHPDFYDRACDKADMDRKRAKEDAMDARDAAYWPVEKRLAEWLDKRRKEKPAPPDPED